MKLTGRICPYLIVCVFLLSSALTAQQPDVSPSAAPPRVVPPQAPDPLERMFSISVYDWLPQGRSAIRGGVHTTNPSASDLDLPKNPRRAYGATITIPTKGATRLEISYLTLSDSGNAVASRDTNFLGGTIPQNEPLSLAYTLRHVKASWNYLTYPNPSVGAKFRLKTLWEVHYVQVNPTVQLNTLAPDQVFPGDKRSLFLPAVGLGLEFVPSSHFRMEARGSGMAFPDRAALGDAEATAVVRIRRLEIFAGGKAFYYRTSPQKTNFVKGSLWGPHAGVRWVF